MKVTVIGAGNSGFAMAAHLSKYGNEVTLWNRSRSSIATIMEKKSLVDKDGTVINSDKVAELGQNNLKDAEYNLAGRRPLG